MKKLENIESMGETKVKESLRGVFGVNMSSFVIAMVCILFLATAVFEPQKQEASLYEIIVNSALVFAVTMSLNYLFKDKAIRDAKKSEAMIDAEKDFDKKVDEVIEADNIDDLEEWCKEQNAKNYRLQRSKILIPTGLAYSECYNEDGTAKNKEIHIPTIHELTALGIFAWVHERRTAKRQRKAIIRARYLHLSELSAAELTSEGDDANDPYKLGRSQETYVKQTTQKTVASKVIIAVVTGYYFAALIADFSVLNLCTKVMQISIALVFGAIEYISTTGYVLNELRGRFTKKTQILKRFLSKREKGDDTYSREVPSQLGHPDHEGTGAGPTDRELHPSAS